VVSQLRSSNEVREEWFSLGENHEKLIRFGLYQLRNRSIVGQKGQSMTNESGSASPPRDPPGNERTRRLEIALRRSEKLAMAGRLAASVMHEINNPSQAIAGLVFLLAKDADRPDLVRAHAAQIEEQLVRVQYITRQTLAFFRDPPRTQKKDLVPLVEIALRYHAGLVQEKHIEVRKEMPDMLVASVYPGDFLQLVSNLIRNAIEALPVGGLLRLRLRASEDAAQLTVADTGRGIPLPIQARLFEAFQSDKAEAGNGLGLWICKTIVEKHGGQIKWRSSTKGKTHGTVFSVWIPLEAPRENESAASAAVL
jgi:two-component system, NtrC family, sensor kinase